MIQTLTQKLNNKKLLQRNCNHYNLYVGEQQQCDKRDKVWGTKSIIDTYEK